jgi:hypothetical protein
VPALDDLGVAGDDPHAGRLGGARDRLHLQPQRLGVEPLLEDQRERERDRPRAAHGQVVGRAVDGQRADRPAREAQWPDHEGVGGQRERADRCGIVERREPERRRQQPFDQRLGRLPAGAVGHRDPLVAEPCRLGAGRLDDPEHALLTAHTAVRSRASRP